MKNICLLFPGQGSQYVGMAKSFLEIEKFKKLSIKASEIINQPITKLMLDGPIEELTKTQITQVAILLHSYIAFLYSQENGVQASMALGHSLGEYSALVASEVISFEDAVALVYKRGVLMSKACPHNDGSMAAVLGLDASIIEETLESFSDENSSNYVAIANYNTDNQTVIAGKIAGINKVKELLLKKGAKKIIDLNVSAPFHCAMMKPVAEEMSKILQNISFATPKFSIISNVSGLPQNNPQDIKRLIIEQIASPVRFKTCVEYIKNNYQDTSYLELGPKNVLCGLVKKIDLNAHCKNLDSLEGTSNV